MCENLIQEARDEIVRGNDEIQRIIKNETLSNQEKVDELIKLGESLNTIAKSLSDSLGEPIDIEILGLLHEIRGIALSINGNIGYINGEEFY